jgi:DNA-binding MarR family transcriptional regulator
MGSKPSGDGKAHWSDVAVAQQRALHSFDALVQPVLGRYGLSKLGIANLLFLLSIGKGRRRVSDIVKSERYNSSNASYALSVLADAALVDRFMDLVDKRMRLVEATVRGRKLIDEIQAVAAGDRESIAAALEAAFKLTEYVDSRAAAPVRPAAEGGTP